MSESPELDIRWPIGLLFALMGIALAAYGALAAASPISTPHGINLNLAWGVVMLLFGLLMIWGAWRAGRRPA
jgi:hypothetical protein